MILIKLNDEYYEASVVGLNKDAEWDNRESKTIKTNELTYESIVQKFVDDIEWYIVVREQYTQLYAYDAEGNEIYEFEDPETGEPVPMYDRNGNPITEPLSRIAERDTEYDNSDYSVAGDITNHRNGYFSIKMGKPTDLEDAYELLYGEEA